MFSPLGQQSTTPPQQQAAATPFNSAGGRDVLEQQQQQTLARLSPAAEGGMCTCVRAPLQLQYYSSELSLLQGFCAVVQALDPDVIVGWDIQQGSLGYVADRGLQLGFNVLRSASKTPEVRSHGSWWDVQHDCVTVEVSDHTGACPARVLRGGSA
jgi:DNA polymerase elongation subunit (family B)